MKTPFVKAVTSSMICLCVERRTENSPPNENSRALHTKIKVVLLSNGILMTCATLCLSRDQKAPSVKHTLMVLVQEVEVEVALF